MGRNNEDRLEGDAFAQRTGRKLKEAEMQGIYSVRDDLVISIIPETCWYTVGTGSEE